MPIGQKFKFALSAGPILASTWSNTKGWSQQLTSTITFSPVSILPVPLLRVIRNLAFTPKLAYTVGFIHQRLTETVYIETYWIFQFSVTFVTQNPHWCCLPVMLPNTWWNTTVLFITTDTVGVVSAGTWCRGTKVFPPNSPLIWGGRRSLGATWLNCNDVLFERY